MCVHDLPPESSRQKNHIFKERLCSLSIGGNNHKGVSDSYCLLTHASQKRGRDLFALQCSEKWSLQWLCSGLAFLQQGDSLAEQHTHMQSGKQFPFTHPIFMGYTNNAQTSTLISH